MNNQGGNYGRAPAPGQNNNNNIYPHSLRAQLDPQYQAALELEELHLRRELEIQQDLELRRRLQNLASQQIVEELEYRNQLQQLHQYQSQQDNFNNIMAQVQQQPYGQNDLLTSLHDEYLLQRHQQLLMQEQMQQRMQQRIIAEGLAQAGSQEQNYGAAAAYLEQEALRNAALATDEALIEQARIFQGDAQDLNPAQSETTTAAAVEHPDNSVNASHTKPDTVSNALDKLESTKEYTAKKKPGPKPNPANKNVPAHSSAERERLLLMAKSLASQKKPSIATASESTKSENDDKAVNKDEKLAATKKRKSSEEVAGEGADRTIESKVKEGKKRKNSKPGKEKKPVQEITKAGKLDGRTKKARELKKQALAEQRMLTDQEQTIVNFLSGKNSGKDKNKKDAKKRRSEETDDDFAAKIVLTFKATTDIPAKELKVVRLWSKKGSHRQIDPPISEKDYPQLTPNLKFNLPLLPAEPEYVEIRASKTNINLLIDAITSSGIVSAAESASILANLSRNSTNANDHLKTSVVNKTKNTHVNKWWPADDEIQQERKLLDTNDSKEKGSERVGGKSVTKNSLNGAKKRLEKSVEPGVVEILPYCQLREANGAGIGEPVFCSQVADLHPNEPMVCCSKCSTWRHIKCGGHHERQGFRRSSNEVFEPLCDRCHLEQDLLEDVNKKAVERIETQRDQHLHRCNATNAVIQQFAFARHFHSKWPLGSVAPAHFAGHVKGVQARHEKAKQQWEEMVMKLNCETQLAKDRVRTRTRALERLLHSVDDAELNTDIHNMILFLKNDTDKPHPVGFENLRRNIFDPEEDPAPAVVVEDLKSESTMSDEDSKMKGVEALMGGCETDISDDGRSKSQDESNICARVGCQQKPRFDSAFCSDSCGVNALEVDLLHSLKYAQELHPSVLRSGM